MVVSDIPGSVIKKSPKFCKCLRFSKSRFSGFSNFSGRQKRTAIAAIDQHIIENFIEGRRYSSIGK